MLGCPYVGTVPHPDSHLVQKSLLVDTAIFMKHLSVSMQNPTKNCSDQAGIWWNIFFPVYQSGCYENQVMASNPSSRFGNNLLRLLF